MKLAMSAIMWVCYISGCLLLICAVVEYRL